MTERILSDHLLEKKEVQEILRCGRQKLQNMINDGEFPAREKNHGFWVKSKVEYAVKFGKWNENDWKQWELEKLANINKAA